MANIAQMVVAAGKSDFLPLMENPLYAAMSASVRAAVEAKARKVSIAAGQTLFRQGDPSNGVYALLSGGLEYSRTSRSGRHSILNVLNPGKWIGDISTLDEQGRTLDCHALTDSTLLHLSRADFLALFETQPGFSKMLILLQGERVRQLLDWTETLTKLPAEGRLAERLCIFAQSHGRPVADGTRIDLVLSQEKLAAAIGTTRQRINQILSLWVNEGLIRHDERHLVLCDVPALKQRIEMA